MNKFLSKLKWFVAGTVFVFAGTVFAVSQPSFAPSFLPLQTDTYYLGSTSPNLEWNGLYVKNINISGTCTGTGCSSGGSGSPGGLNTQIQYNNSGAFGGISGATTNGTIVSLTNPLLGGATLTTSSVNGVTLTTGGGTSTFLNANGAYSTPTGGGGTFPFTSFPNYNATSTTLGFLNGLFSTASSTFSAPFYLSTLGQGTVNIGASGLIYSTATTSISVGSPLTVTGTLGALIGGTNSTINCQTASGSQAGCLASIDWTTFNNKQPAGSYLTGYDAWTHPYSASSATTSTVYLTNGFAANASSSIAGLFTTNYASSTIYASFFNASTTKETDGILTIPSLGTPAGTFLAADANGKVIATSTPNGSSTNAVSLPVQYATATALPANTYAGGVLTEVGTGALSVDGNSPVVGNRILVKNEVGQTNNGIYSVTATGSGIAAYVLTRVSDYNSSANVIPGEATYVISGTVNSDDWWALTTSAPITVGGGGTGSNLTYIETSGGAASVTSVGLTSTNSTLTVGNTPITSSGNITADLNLGHQNTWTTSQNFNGIGNGTTTPQWELQSASTTPQLALTNTVNNNHVVLNVISNGDLAIASASPQTFATSTNGDPNLGPVTFNNNGGCTNCSDITLTGGINLRNANYIEATTTGTSVTANVMNDFYTAPAGKRVAILNSFIWNDSGSSSNYTFFLKTGGNYYRLTATTTVTNGTTGNISAGIILDPGQGLSEIQTGGGIIRMNAISFDSSVPFHSIMALNPAGTATSTLYTVPTGTTALMSSGSFISQFGANTASNLTFGNNGAGTVSHKIFLVQNGQTANDSVNAVETGTATYAASVSTIQAIGTGTTVLNSGDSIQYFLGSAPVAGSVLWTNVYEH